MWPFHATLHTAARPFVLQHALKYLLLVPPSERFQGFAKLLGLNEVDGTFQAILGLCTKPTASIPPEGQLILSELLALETRVTTVPELKKVAANFKRGAENADNAYALIYARSDVLLGEMAKAVERIPKLIAARTEAAAKVYSGEVTLHAYSPEEASQLAFAHKILSTAVSASSSKIMDNYAFTMWR